MCFLLLFQSPKQHNFENKQTHPAQSKVKSTPAPAPAPSTFTGLNDDFDDSDDSDNEMSNTRKDAGQDYSLGRFTPTRTSQTARSVPNFSNFDTDFTSAPESKKPESKPSSKNKVYIKTFSQSCRYVLKLVMINHILSLAFSSLRPLKIEYLIT